MTTIALRTILLLHFFLVFTLSASFTSLPTDMIENLIWGSSLDFSSDKHPPFFGWESYLTVRAFGGNLLFYHILTPLHQVALLYFVYLLAGKILNCKKKALLAVVLAEGIILHSIHYKFNANTANYGFFTAIYYFFYSAIKEEKYHLLIPVGILCGIIMLIKYSGILLIGSLCLVLLITKEGKKAFKSPFLYIGILSFFAVLFPYIISILKTQNYGAVNYLVDQSYFHKRRWFEVPRFLLFPFLFSLPFLLAFFKIKTERINRSINFDSIFLLSATFTPFAAVFLWMVFAGAEIGAYWMSMFYSLFPICCLYFWNVKKDALSIAKKVVINILLPVYITMLCANLVNMEDDTKEIGKFIKELSNNEIDYFVCNDNFRESGRRVCGIIFIYGSDYKKTKMIYLKWQDLFLEIKNQEKKPNKILIIGDSKTIDLPEYTLTTHVKSFSKLFKFKLAEKIFNALDSKFNIANKKNVEIKIIIATLKTNDKTTLSKSS